MKRLIEETPFIEDTLRKLDLAPYLTPTEIAFSNRSLRKMHDFKHWKKAHNHRTFGYERKIDQDAAQIFKKRFPSIKRQKLEGAGIKIPSGYKNYSEVLQVYMPLEHWLMEEMCQSDSSWAPYFASLSLQPLERIAQLKAPKAALEKEFEEYNATMNSYKRYSNKLKSIELPIKDADALFRDFDRTAPRGLLDAYYLSLENLRNQYRSIYVALDKQSRTKIRTGRLTSKKNQIEFSFEQFSQIDNFDIIKLVQYAKNFMPLLPESRQRELNRFLSNFNTARRLSRILIPHAKGISPKIAPNDFVYVTFLRYETTIRSEEFFEDFGIRASSDINDQSSLRAPIGNFFKFISNEIKKRRTQVVDHKGDYLYLYGGNLDFSALERTALIPIRIIKNYAVSQPQEVENDNNQLELLAA